MFCYSCAFADDLRDQTLEDCENLTDFLGSCQVANPNNDANDYDSL